MKDEIAYIQKQIAEKNAKTHELANLRKLLDEDFLTDAQAEIVGKQIELLKEEVDSFKQRSITKDIGFVLDKHKKYRLESEDLANVKIEYIQLGFLVKSEITLIAGKSGGGKSLTALAISNMALMNNKVDHVLYFDMDNSISTLKDRKVDTLLNQHKERFQYYTTTHKKNGTGVSEQNIWDILSDLEKANGEEVLIVIDSAKNFLSSGADRDKNKDVSALMKKFKRLRGKKFTIILLHHTNKPQKDIDELTYAGSSAWMEDSSNAFILRHNEYKKTFIFEPIKQRSGCLQERAYIFESETISLKMTPLFESKLSKTDEMLVEAIKTFIASSKNQPTYSDIFKNLIDNGFRNNDKINAVIQGGKGLYWIATKDTKNNNRDIYQLMPDKKDSSDKSKNKQLSQSKSTKE